MKGTAAKLSTLLMMVGLPNRPSMAGIGGLERTMPRLPSSDFQHGGFFAADIGAGAAADLEVEGFVRALDIVAEPAWRPWRAAIASFMVAMASGYSERM